MASNIFSCFPQEVSPAPVSAPASEGKTKQKGKAKGKDGAAKQARTSSSVPASGIKLENVRAAELILLERENFPLPSSGHMLGPSISFPKN